MPGIARPDDVRRQNQWIILMALRRQGLLSRTEISALTGLSASTVTVITNTLLERGMIVAESMPESTSARRGRPQVRLGLNPAAASVAIVVVTLNRMYAMIADYSGKTVATTMDRSRTKGVTGLSIAQAAVHALKSLTEQTSDLTGPLQSILVSVEGIVDSASATLMWSPFIDDSHVPLKDTLECCLLRADEPVQRLCADRRSLAMVRTRPVWR